MTQATAKTERPGLRVEDRLGAKMIAAQGRLTRPISKPGVLIHSPSPPNEKAPLMRGLIIAEKEG